MTDAEDFARKVFTVENTRDKLKVPAHGLLDAPRNEDLVAVADLLLSVVHALRADGKLPA